MKHTSKSIIETRQIALDIHGVIDTNPLFFSELTKCLTVCNWDVHILTGSTLTNLKITRWLFENNIYYNSLFSISDHLREGGYKESEGSTIERPFFSEEDWNKVKGEYCLKHNIPLCLDDRDVYLPSFKTPIARFYSKGYTNNEREN